MRCAPPPLASPPTPLYPGRRPVQVNTKLVLLLKTKTQELEAQAAAAARALEAERAEVQRLGGLSERARGTERELERHKQALEAESRNKKTVSLANNDALDRLRRAPGLVAR